MGVPLISYVVSVLGATLKDPAPVAAKSKGAMPVLNVEFEVSTLPSGPRTRTTLVSIGMALAAMSGGTVTVFWATCTTFDAARLKSRLKRAELPRVMLSRLLGSM